MKTQRETQKLRQSITAAAVLVVLCFAALLEIRPVVILSGSMEPEIPTGSICLISGADCRGAPGKVIAYMLSDHMVVHRISGTGPEPDSYITKGDSNDTADPAPVYGKQIRGTVLGMVPGLGYGVLFLRSRKGGILAVSIVFFIAFVCFRRKYHV